MSTKLLRLLLLLVFIAVPIANYLPFAHGGGSGRFDDDPTTRIDAAGYAFSIWGLIFLGMLLFAAFQLNNPQRSPHQRRAYVYLISAGLASIAFVPISMTDNYVLSMINLYWHLFSLIGAVRALRRHAAAVPRVRYGWTYLAPSVYLGWISAATVIATTLGLIDLGLTVGDPTAIYIASALVLVLTGLGNYFAQREDLAYALTVSWALIAVAVAQSDAPFLMWLALGGAAGAGGYGLYRLVTGGRPLY